ncbi:hypothetical protein D0T25_18485 [Duganella sp. BJB488]|nr:hypothetical protein D0T26_19285 [Duganella sp. BJB489]RFP19680.1 hypothetical protein D0T25_18485 [Duganella sp. BJB488]RFP38070.1 hypothetical protein D0T24_00235 [Duganella sp. BJB480]
MIDGISYNSETSTLINRRPTHADTVKLTEHGPKPVPRVEELYRNRSGKLFFVYRDMPIFDVVRNQYVLRDEVRPVLREEAGAWLNDYFPDTHDAFVLNMKFGKAPEENAEAMMSLRIDPYLKTMMKHAADDRKMSVNAVGVHFFRYCLNHSIDLPTVPTTLFKTEHGVALLTPTGKPGFNGIEDDGNNDEHRRAMFAAAFWRQGKAIPEPVRHALLYLISSEGQAREELLGDLRRWLELYERPRANLSSALVTNFRSGVFHDGSSKKE